MGAPVWKGVFDTTDNVAWESGNVSEGDVIRPRQHVRFFSFGARVRSSAGKVSLQRQGMQFVF